MKFCFFSMDFRRFPLEYSFQMAAKYGVKGLEVFGARPHLYPADMTPARLNEIAGYKKKYGVEIPMYTPLCLGHTTNLCSQNPIERQDCMDHFRKCIDIAEYLEIPNMLLTADHPGYQTPRRVAWKQFVENMQELSSYADGKGVNLTIEAVTPMESPVITTSEDLRDVLDDIGRDNVNTMLDVVPPLIAYEPFSAYFDKLGSKVAHVHLCDYDGVTEAHLRLGSGKLPLYEFISILKQYNYQGYVSTEFYSEYYADPEVLLISTLKKLRDICEEIGY